MPVVLQDLNAVPPRRMATGRTLEPAPEVESPSFLETARAAMEQDSAVWNAMDLVTRPTFEPEPGYNPADDELVKPYIANHRESFIGSTSAKESAAIIDRINRERKNQELLASSGLAGMATSMFFGIADPTVLLPGGIYVKATRGVNALRSAAGAAALGGAAVGAQEGVLQAAQETRTAEESAMAIGAGTLVGGILGGAIGGLTRAEVSAIARKAMAPDMVGSPGNRPIYNAPASVGAAASQESAGGLKSAPGANIAAEIGPVTRSLKSPFDQARRMAALLADAGATLEGNERGIATALGGTVENRVRMRYSGLGEAIPEMDRLYAEYWFDGKMPNLAVGMRGRIGSEWARVTGSLNGRLTAKQFREEVARAMDHNDQHPIPQVAAAAKTYREKVYNPLWEAAKRNGLVPEEAEELVGAESYLNRVYLIDKIVAQPQEFIAVVAANAERKMQQQFLDELAKVKGANARAQEDIADLQMDAVAREAQIEALRYELTLQEKGNPQFIELEEKVNELRKASREAPERATSRVVDGKVVPGDESMTRKGLLAEARRLEKEAGEEYTTFRKERAKMRRRQSNLRYAGMEGRQQRTLELIEATEDRMLKSLDRVVKAGQRIQRELDKIPDDKLDAEISRIKDMFEKLAKTYDRGEEQLVKLSTEGDDADLYGLMDLQNARAGRLSDVAERLERVEAFDRAEARAEIMRSVDDVVGRVAVLNQRRAVRVEKLKARAKALNPKLVDERVKGLQARMVERLNNVADRWRTQGDFDLESGKADFSGRARELAEEITNKIIGNTSLRLPGIDILQGERGPELARLLDIDNDLIEPWLERDIERLSRIYTHTLAPDVEIAGKFGSVRAEEAFKRLEDEFNAKRAALPEGDEKAATRLQRDYEETVRDLEAVIGRLRHNWALPDNPRGLGHRLARTAIAFNYLRYMGGVTISSVPDMARPIMRYGLTHTFRHGFAPLVKNLKAVKLNAKQVKLAGTALDMILDTRQQALGDLFMDWQRGTKAERVLEYASNRFGLVSLMAPWNAAMKQFTGVLAIQDLLNAAEATRLGKATKRQTEILAANGIDAELAGRIMNQLEAGGGEKVDGQWLPNTEDWTDGAAVEAFRTAIVREVDNAIITPGVERPLWQSKLLGSADLGKLIGQFRSFSTSSVSKMMIAGLQQRDMAMVNGLVTSMALGALSYYLYGLATGGRAYEEMMNAGPEKWAAEAIERSGVLTVLSDANRIAEATPLRGISRFTGEQLTRQQPTDIFGAALGPSADLASRLVRGVSGFATGDPTKSDLHNLRVALIAGQNLFYLRRALDKIEEYVNLPERRESSASRKRGVLE